jgi:hypothetical protein
MTVAAARKVYGHGKKRKKMCGATFGFAEKRLKRGSGGRRKKGGWAGDERLAKFFPSCI